MYNIRVTLDDMGKLATAFRRTSNDWKLIRSGKVMSDPMDIYMKALEYRTPMSSYERYGEHYPGVPGTMRKVSELSVAGESDDMIVYRVETDPVDMNGKSYASYVREMDDQSTQWTTAGTGSEWFELAWRDVEGDFTTVVGDNAERAVGKSLEESL